MIDDAELLILHSFIFRQMMYGERRSKMKSDDSVIPDVRVQVWFEKKCVEYPVLVPIGHTDRLDDITGRADMGHLVGITYDDIYLEMMP